MLPTPHSVASTRLGSTCPTVRGTIVDSGGPCVLGPCIVSVILFCKSLPCSRSQHCDVVLGPDLSLGPDLDGGFLDLLPLEVRDAADDLKSDQVEVASVWSVWDFWRWGSGSGAMTSSPPATPTDHTADQLKAVDMGVGDVRITRSCSLFCAIVIAKTCSLFSAIITANSCGSETIDQGSKLRHQWTKWTKLLPFNVKFDV